MSRKPISGRLADAGERVAQLLAEQSNYKRLRDQRYRLAAADVRLLYLLSDGRARTFRDISEELHLEQSTVNRQVNSALKSGLLQRHRVPGDRAWIISPSERGLDLYRDDSAWGRDAFTMAMRGLGKSDAEQFVALLETFVLGYRKAALAGDADD